MSSMYRYWPFRSRTRSSDKSAPRGRLEEEVVDTLGVRGVATGREGVTASSAARELSIAVESATLEDEDESKSSRTSSRDASRRLDASGSLRRSHSSPAAAMPAQPGVALQETPVFAAQAVLIKRERSGNASRSKRANSLLSRSVGRDGKELPTMTRSNSWNSRLRHFGSDDDGSPGSESPRLAPPRR